MPNLLRTLVILLSASALAACGQEPYTHAGPPACMVTSGVTLPPTLKLSPVLTGTTIVKPVEMHPAPDGTEQVYILSQPGIIHRADKVSDTGTAPVFLDIRDRVEDGPNEAGLLGLAFPPDYGPEAGKSGAFYVNYTRIKDGQLQTVISRFTTPKGGKPDPTGEEIILTIDQPYSNHNGGAIAFGPDGMLYISMGDGGSGGDPQNHGQRLDSLLGKILRVDPRTPSGMLRYTIPSDNPFVTTNGARKEIWAYGLRNVWRMSFDPATGVLWGGDVGQVTYEEIDILTKGGNYGWRRVEGPKCYDPATDCMLPGMIPPAHAYGRGDGKSVTGGHVYRGKAMASLFGTYVFGDFVSGTVWGLVPGLSGAYNRGVLVENAGAIAAFGLDAQGELYVLEWSSGRILRLSQADPNAMGTPGWPEKLSETGCYSDLPGRKLLPSAYPYNVNVPLWSDGADKERALLLPMGQRLLAPTAEETSWDLPTGSLLVKTFLFDKKPIETRFLLRDLAGYRGATYRWNEAGTDGELVAGAVSDVVLGRQWYFPSRSDCLVCHTRAAGQVLGISTHQLNHRLPDGKEQLRGLAEQGAFGGGILVDPSTLPRYPGPANDMASIGERARAYLAVNCGNCHQPGGLANATVDLRAATPLGKTGLCMPPQQGDLGVSGARILLPGVPDKSTLYLRMATTDPTKRMPNLATSVPDTEGLALIKRWIEMLPGCE